MNTVTLDAEQHRAATRLCELAGQLERRGRLRGRSAFRTSGRFLPLPRRPRPHGPSRGIYLHGRPGRGKTMLMDEFFANVTTDRKRRYHFHEFFARLHNAIAAFGELPAALNVVLEDVELLCFDEFHVHDVGDAILLTRLLEALFARRIALVVTSNYPPEQLLPNPLTHAKFEPAIALLRTHLDVLPVDGGQDYRLLGGAHTGFAAGIFVHGECPIQGRVDLAIAHRVVHARAAGNDELTIDFAELCGSPLSAADYLTLTRTYRCWTVCEVPALHSVPIDWRTRWTSLIDVLYDADLELNVYAEVSLPDLIDSSAGTRDLQRTASRLSRLSGARVDEIR